MDCFRARRRTAARPLRAVAAALALALSGAGAVADDEPDAAPAAPAAPAATAALAVAEPSADGSAIAPPSARDADDALDAAFAREADALLNAVRRRIAACSAGPTLVASAATDASSDATAAVDRPRLRWNPRLARAATMHADAMARTTVFDHVGTGGDTVRERVDATGYRWRVVAENLAAGHDDLAEAVTDWLASRSHCESLLDARFTEFGLARARSRRADDAYGIYWTLVLGRPH